MTARPATPISVNFRRCATIDLSKRSASWPPRPERKKNGAMNTAAASVISASAFSPPILNTIRKASAFLRKLSLKAEKNWHQNSGEKRRDISREVDIGRILNSRAGGSCPGTGQSRGILGDPANRATDYSGAVMPVLP